MTQIDACKRDNAVSKEKDEALQRDIESMYAKLQKYTEHDLYPLQTAINVQQPLARQKAERNAALNQAVERKQQALERLCEHKATKETEMQQLSATSRATAELNLVNRKWKAH